MSFMANGADCSASNNPLAQFNKHGNSDRSLQQSLANQQHAAQRQFDANAAIRSLPQMDRHEQERFANFAAGKDPLQHAGGFQNFQPMHHELNRIANNNNAMSWTEDYRNVSASPVTHAPQTLSSEGKMRMSSNWSSDFATSSRSSPQNVAHGALPMRYMSPMMGMSRFSGARLLPLPQPGKVVELDSAKWEDEFSEIEKKMLVEQQLEAQAESQDDGISVDDKYKANFDEVWDSLNTDFKNDEFFNQEYEASWEKDFKTYASGRLHYGQYKHSTKNQFQNNPDAYEIGLKLMENGARLSEALLLFEAAVQQDDGHVEAWLKLGQVQTQNEKELLGISLLEKCLELDPANLTLLMTLLISYVNEGYDNLLYATMERWIETKYPALAEQLRTDNPKINDEDRYSLNKRITELFIKLLQLSPELASMDADVQTGLGVLFYSMEEFDKTIDCFRAAIQQNPNDSLMWNRLGASLANSNQSEELIELYSRLLQLNPNFVRARYNLGVSCINMGLYQQAVEHLLSGLSMHNIEGVQDTSSGSISLLETLKRLFLAMDRRDLVDKVRPGMDLGQFKGEFNF